VNMVLPIASSLTMPKSKLVPGFSISTRSRTSDVRLSVKIKILLNMKLVKRLSSAIMDRTGTPAAFWLLCHFYVVFLLDHMSSEALDGIAPLEAAAGIEADVSPIL
jgi:hypothetical protein